MKRLYKNRVLSSRLSNESIFRVISLTLIFSFMFQAVSLIPIDLSLSGNKINTAFAEQKQIAELTNKRTEKSKTYLNLDGSYTTEVSQAPINFKNSKGEYEEIDSSVVKRPDGKFENKKGPFKVVLNKNPKESIFSLSKANTSIIYSENGNTFASTEPVVKEYNEIEYQGINNDIKINYRVGNDRVKESIILKKRPNEPISFSFKLALNNLTPEENEGNIILKNKETGEEVFEIEKPYMFDSTDSPEGTSYNVSMDAKMVGSDYIITIIPDQNWLSDPKIIYPVTIDPTVTDIYPDVGAYDTYIRQDYPNNSYSGSNTMYIGRDHYQDLRFHSLFKFGMPSISSSSPYVTNAFVNLTQRSVDSGFTGTTSIYRVLKNWNGGATWNKFDGATNWTSAGGDYDGNALDSQAENPSVTTKTYYVTSAVRSWLQGTATNYGFILINSAGGHYKYESFYTKDFGVQSYYPKLTFTYDAVSLNTINDQTVAEGDTLTIQASATNSNGNAVIYSATGLPPTGTTFDPITGLLKYIPTYNTDPATYNVNIRATDNSNGYLYDEKTFTINVTDKKSNGGQPYWTYKEVGPVRVNLLTGNLMTSNTDLSINGLGVPARVSRTYNSNDTNTSIFGKGFSSYPDSVRISYNGQTATLTDETGSQYTYTQNQNGTFNNPSGIYDNLVKSETDTFTLNKKNKTKLEFDSAGKLVSEIDKNGIALNFSYENGHIKTITDVKGRTTTFTYDTSNTYVTEVVDFTGRTFKYQIDGNGFLRQFEEPVSDTKIIYTQYDYNADGLLSAYKGPLAVANPAGGNTSITYNNKSAASITNPLGKTYSFNYQTTNDQSETPNSTEVFLTTVTDPKNNQYSNFMTSNGLVTIEGEPMGKTADPSVDDPSTPDVNETYGEEDFPDDEGVEDEANDDYDAFIPDLPTEEQNTNANVGIVDGTQTLNEYDSDYNLTKFTDKDGKITTYQYDPIRGNLLIEVDSLGETSTYEYVNDNLETETKNGKTTTYTYDSKSNMTGQTDPENNKTTYEYDPATGNKIWEVSPKGNVQGANQNDYKTFYYYEDTNPGNGIDETGLYLSETTDPEGVSSYYTYDVLGKKLTERKDGKNPVENTYDYLGRLVTSKSPEVTEDGNTLRLLTKNEYDDDGNKTKDEVYQIINSVVDTSPSRLTTYDYNNADQLLASHKKLSDSQTATNSYTYDANGNKETETDPLGKVTTYEYDKLNRLTKETYPDGNFTAYKYDAVGNVVKEGSPSGTSVNLYGKNGEQVATADPVGDTTKQIYDKEGNEVKTADAKNQTTQITYTNNGNIDTVIDPNNKVTDYAYDPNQNQTNTITPNPNDSIFPLTGTSTSSDYNRANQQKTEVDQNSKTTTLSYSQGDLSNIAQPNNKDQQAQYSEAGNLVQLNAAGTTANSYDTKINHDAFGNPISIKTFTPGTTTNPLTQVNTTYDMGNRVSSTSDLSGYAINYFFDITDKLTSVSTNGTTNYNYTNSRLTSITDQNNNITSFNYDLSGNLLTTTYPESSSLSTNLNYDAASKVTDYTNKKGADTLSDYDYEYDATGNITKTTEFNEVNPKNIFTDNFSSTISPAYWGILGNTYYSDGVAVMQGNDQSGWYNSAWLARKPITITNSGSTLTNYQVAVNPGIYDNSNLAGSWHFNEGAGSSTADMSGISSNATLNNGPAWVTGKYGNALSFDGTDDYVELPQVTGFGRDDNKTIELWFKASPGGGGYFYNMSYYTGGNSWFEFMPGIRSDNGKIETWAYIQNNGTRNDLYIATPEGVDYRDGQWHQYVFTYQGGPNPTAKAYVDGSLTGDSSSFPLTAFSWNASQTYGNTLGRARAYWYNSGAYSYFNGSLDEAKVYNRVLSDTETSDRYSSGTPKVRPDYQDLRFTNAAGNELPYWQETDSKFWVKADSLSTGDNTIYEYYGNPNASFGGDYANNGTNTFEDFDSFDNLSKWTQQAGSWSISNGALQIPDTGGTIGYLRRNDPNPLNTDYITRLKLSVEESTITESNHRMFMALNSPNPLSVDQANIISWYEQYQNTQLNWLFHDYWGSSYTYSTISDYPAHTWLTSEVSISEAQDKITVSSGDSSVNYGSHATTNTKDGGDYWGFVTAYSKGQVDWVLIRKYSPNEPTVSVGTSQSEYSTGFYSTQDFNDKIDLNKLPVIEVDFKTDSTNPYTYLGLEGSGKSLGLEYKANDIYVKLNNGNNVSYSMALDGAQVNTWYTAKFELSSTGVKVYVVKQDGTKSQAFTYNISGWSPMLRFYSRNGNTNIDNVSIQARREVYDYTYDNLNRLTKVTDNVDSSTVDYTYDALGNRKTKVNSAGTTSYIYSSANELQSVDNPTGDDIAFEYDANGNTTKKTQGSNITNYTYDNKNQLVKVVKPNGDIIEYVYDGSGNRYSKTVNGVTRYYHYDTGGNITGETDGDNNRLVKYVRDLGGQAISMIQDSNTYYFLYNAHGDVTGLTDSNGSVVTSYSYDEFGNLISSTGSIYNPLRYSGANNAYYDTETGLYKMGVRYYMPDVGRWLTRDKADGDTLQSMNKYAYAENNPVNKVDPTGNAAWTSTRRINSSDRTKYRNHIKNNWGKWYDRDHPTGKDPVYHSDTGKDCADFAMWILINFAKAYKLSLVLKSDSKSYDSASGDYSDFKSYRDAVFDINADMLARLNTKSLKNNWKTTTIGDLLLAGEKTAYDTKVVSSKGSDKKGNYFWVIHKNPKKPIDHTKWYYNDDNKTITSGSYTHTLYNKHTSRWNWQ